MRLFGRRSNQQSGSANSDVPPELRQYYNSPPGASNTIARLIALLVIVLILAGLLGASLWHNILSMAHKNSPHTATSQQQKPKSNSTNHSTTPPSSPSPQSTQSKSASPSPSPSASSSNPTPTPQPTPTSVAVTPQPSTNSRAIPNTGPGETVLFIAPIVSVIGAVGFHIRQVRLLRNHAR